MAQIHEHLQATSKPSVHHAAGNSTATSLVSHQPVQPVFGIVFEKEFFDEINTASKPEAESSLPDENYTVDSNSTCESSQESESNVQKNTSDGPRYSFSTDIPETYDDFYLCVLPRDPKMLYVYWELPDGTRSEKHTFQEQAPSKEQLVLRVKSQTIDNNVTYVKSSYDIPIQSNASDSYVHVPTGSHQCSVECGIVNEQGNFKSYTLPDCKHDQFFETEDSNTGHKMECHRQSDESGLQTAPVSVGTPCMGPVTDASCPAYINTSVDTLVRNIDLPIVKLDSTRYLGSATPA